MSNCNHILCKIGDIPDGKAKRFPTGEGSMFVVRQGDRVFGYNNACPHLGVELDFNPDEFLNPEGSHIICSTHGALFEIESGLCVAGPCSGDALQPVELEVSGDVVFI